jgi:hypothetical protein
MNRVKLGKLGKLAGVTMRSRSRSANRKPTNAVSAAQESESAHPGEDQPDAANRKKDVDLALAATKSGGIEASGLVKELLSSTSWLVNLGPVASLLAVGAVLCLAPLVVQILPESDLGRLGLDEARIATIMGGILLVAGAVVALVDNASVRSHHRCLARDTFLAQVEMLKAVSGQEGPVDQLIRHAEATAGAGFNKELSTIPMTRDRSSDPSRPASGDGGAHV